jgi:hypothetical protein
MFTRGILCSKLYIQLKLTHTHTHTHTLSLDKMGEVRKKFSMIGGRGKSYNIQVEVLLFYPTRDFIFNDN